MKKAVKLDATDNVMTCTSEIFSGEFVESAGIAGDTVQSVENIPAWHKIALRDIRKGEKIFKKKNFTPNLKKNFSTKSAR